MNFLFDNSHFTDIEAAEGGCYLITNGLGGYSCLDLAGGTSRNDHAIFMAAVKAPNVRYNMITNLLIDMTVDGIIYHLSTQRMRPPGKVRADIAHAHAKHPAARNAAHRGRWVPSGVPAGCPGRWAAP